MAAIAALDPVGEQRECTSHMQITKQMTPTTVRFPQAFPFEVAGGSLRGGPILRVN
jgi:hypothetical protein